MLTNRVKSGAAIALTIVVGGVIFAGYTRLHRNASAPRLVYDASGYGGFTAAPRVRALPKPSKPPVPNPVLTAADAYGKGHYREAESLSLTTIHAAARSHDLGQREQAAQARLLLAYSAARRNDLSLARRRFADLQAAASLLPDKGTEPAEPGEVGPTLEQEAAYEHAVCTAALGDTAGAENEYGVFLRRWPDSAFAHGALTRAERLNGGTVPPGVQTAYDAGQKSLKQQQIASAKAASLCGPECLAELLRRRHDKPDIHSLADEMGTGVQGTSLAAFSTALQHHGFSGQGLALTARGLQAQALPVIALARPGHYLIVERVAGDGVTVWDPDARGIGRGGPRRIPSQEWRTLWMGAVLTLAPAEHLAQGQTLPASRSGRS